jgi:hypothetical protein
MTLITNDALYKICEFLDSFDKIEYSQVNRSFRLAYTRGIKCLNLIPLNSKREDIFVQYFKSYTNSNKIIVHNFNDKHLLYLINLILFIGRNPAALINIKNLVFEEIVNQKTMKGLSLFNEKLLESFGHDKLESLEIIMRDRYSKICDNIKCILDFTPKLKKFKISCCNQSCNILFENQKELIMVKFSNYCNLGYTLNSLNKCPKLKTLIFNMNFKNFYNVMDDLKLYYWPNIIRLEVCVNSEEELINLLNNFPNLEHLSIEFYFETNLSMIGKKLLNLQILIIKYYEPDFAISITDDQVYQLTSALPKLKLLSIVNACPISNKGIIHIATNCPKLEVLKIKRIKVCDNEDFKILIDKCPDLVVLNINFHDNVKIEEIKYLLNVLKKLRYISINNLIEIVLRSHPRRKLYEQEVEEYKKIKEQYSSVCFYIPMTLKHHKFTEYSSSVFRYEFTIILFNY